MVVVVGRRCWQQQHRRGRGAGNNITGNRSRGCASGHCWCLYWAKFRSRWAGGRVTTAAVAWRRRRKNKWVCSLLFVWMKDNDNDVLVVLSFY